MAAGGQGAPLVPLVDCLLFRSASVGRVMLNIGGIANLTVLPAGCGPQGVMAFDTGPGNMLIDALVAHLSDGRSACDEGGRTAASGAVDGELLGWLMGHPFLSKTPPKSTGRETFGKAALKDLLARGAGLSEPDLVRTVTAFTSESIADAVRRFVTPSCRVDELVVSGGGTENPVLMGGLQAALGALRVTRIDALGIPSEAKEALAFAVLANETLNGRHGNVPQVTGARGPRVLGVVAVGRGARISVD
jgi:anhydro-N-acetylmuramic acid kinase